MPKERSPSYPATSLPEAIEDVRALFDAERRTTVAPEVAVKAWGYKGLSGRARSRLAALKQYGLIHWEANRVRVSERALTLLMASPNSNEYAEALRHAALEPPAFAEFLQSAEGASDDNLQYELVKRGFTREGALRFIKSLRETMEFANLAKEGYDGAVGTGTQGIKGSGPDIVFYSWPLSQHVAVEVKFRGRPTARHLEQLRRYLELAEEALEADDPSGEAPVQEPVAANN